jgi:hypothetical protein
MAFVRALAPAAPAAAASIFAVTSVNRFGTVTRMVFDGSSSPRARARKPLVIRSRAGVECSCTTLNRQ